MVCPGESVTVSRVSGRLIHQATAGDANQISSIGAAMPKAAGLIMARPTRPTVAKAGAGHMERKDPPRPDRLLCLCSLDAFHSRSRRCEKSIRQIARRIASRLKKASYGMQANVNSPWAKCRPKACTTSGRCCVGATSSGFWNRSRRALKKMGTNTVPRIARVHAQAGDNRSQLNSNRRTSAAGARLRRRLSTIFHRERADSGFFSVLCSGPGTRGSIHRAICQSPRIQR